MLHSFLSNIILDVRSPAEFEKGHIPGAVNLPLFSNEERHEVGLCYKKQGHDAAVKLGLTLVGPKLKTLVEQAESLAQNRAVSMYCWRGGMRSGSMAWLLKTAGFEVTLLKGGYKFWRNQIHSIFENPISLITVGGFTGSGKTELLAALHAQGEQVLDLEAIANHRGSAFGKMGDQPSTEHFENRVGFELLKMDLNQPIWIEDESKTIGAVYVPKPLKIQMHSAPFVLVHRSKKERIEKLCEMYGENSKVSLVEAFKKLEKRIGGQFVNAALQFLDENDLASACEIALNHYDKAYLFSLEKSNRVPKFELDLSNTSDLDSATKLIQWKNQNLPNSATDRAVDAK